MKEPTSLIIIPTNSILHFDAESELVIDEIKYPWNFLKAVQERNEQTRSLLNDVTPEIKRHRQYNIGFDKIDILVIRELL